MDVYGKGLPGAFTRRVRMDMWHVLDLKLAAFAMFIQALFQAIGSGLDDGL